MSLEPALGDHRGRLIEAMAGAVSAAGLRGTTVADVVRLARTSRRSFYEHFADRESCFLAVVEAVNRDLMAAVAQSVARAREPEAKIDQAVAAFLERIAAEPTLFQSLIRELPGLGDRGAERQREVVQSFAHLLVSLIETERREHPALTVDPLTLDVATIIVGGLRELVVTAIAEGRDVRELRQAAATVVKAVLLRAAADGASPQRRHR
jgi:AcrR family transcriptional regulator